ncbi:MAG: GreA/GreB family elongation factor [Myxococcota bacterium]|nr:GreA/GreB family elongation factor [Myxococcota bacterium]
MATERKRAFIEGLEAQLRQTVAATRQAEVSAGSAAAEMQAEGRRDDSKAVALQGRLATGHRRRREQVVRDLERLRAFAAGRLRSFSRRDPVALGALVDVSVEGDGGAEERSLFLLPAGAGAEVEGPGGDGFVTVATPGSPIGRALLGARVGDTVEVVVAGREAEWTVVDLS